MEKFAVFNGGAERPVKMCLRRVISVLALTILTLASFSLGCRSEINGDKKSVRPRTLRDVPTERLAFRFEADIADLPPAALNIETELATVEADFTEHRKDEALLRTVVSPDGRRAAALYATGETSDDEFRLDMYSSDGVLLRSILPPEIAGAFVPAVAWSPNGEWVAFVGRRSAATQTISPDLLRDPAALLAEGARPEGTATETPTPAAGGPAFAVPALSTEQIYICNRDGSSLQLLTTRDGLIYFHFAWSPDNSSLIALACKEDEWDARFKENKVPAGRPRLIGMGGQERLLDDRLTDVLPVWSPDASKVATAFDTDIVIYDTTINSPTRARAALQEPLLAASMRSSDAGTESGKNEQAVKAGGKAKEDAAAPLEENSGPPLSFNPIVRLEWPQPETMYIQTGFVRVYKGEQVNNYMRWHTVYLSPQAALLG